MRDQHVGTEGDHKAGVRGLTVEIVSWFSGAQVPGQGVRGPCVGEDSRDRTERPGRL